MKVSYQWLREFVTLSVTPNEAAQALTMAGLEVKKIESVGTDYVFETEITSNRPDWLSHLGVARELSAIFRKPLREKKGVIKYSHDSSGGWKVELQDKIACPYYTGIYISGVTNAKAPDFIKSRLESCGVRSISLIVDITNYVLLETGQPLHAFDADLISSKLVQIRRAQPGEPFTPIKGTDVKLAVSDLVIADSSKALALAGVMGGKNSEITDGTRNVFLESAFFHPQWVRLASIRHGIKTDSSYRFERRVDPEMVDRARDRALALILEYARPASIGTVHRVGKKPATAQTWISLAEKDVQKTLGVSVPQSLSAGILKRLGLKVKKTGKKLSALSPSFRPDLTRQIDLIEEVARIYGYHKIPEILPQFTPRFNQSHFEPFSLKLTQMADALVSQGFSETVTFSLVSDPGPEFNKAGIEPVDITNPMNQELRQMRRTLLHSLLGALKNNIHQQAKSVALFEIANTYQWDSKKQQPREEKTLGLLLYGTHHPKTWLDPERVVTYYDLKGVIKNLWNPYSHSPGLDFRTLAAPFYRSDICEGISHLQKDLGIMGEVSSELLSKMEIDGPVFFAEIVLVEFFKVASSLPRFRELPKYPTVQRDLAIVVSDTVKSGAIEKEIRKLGGPLLVQIELFDVFQGGRIPKGNKNLAYRLSYQSTESTLRSEDIQHLHAQIASQLQEKFKASFQLS